MRQLYHIRLHYEQTARVWATSYLSFLLPLSDRSPNIFPSAIETQSFNNRCRVRNLFNAQTTVIPEWMIYQCSKNIRYYFGVWGTSRKYGGAKCSKIFSPAIAGRGQLQKFPKKIKSGFGSGSPPNPIFQAHSGNKILTHRITCTPNSIVPRWTVLKAQALAELTVLIVNFHYHELAWLQITSFRGKREKCPGNFWHYLCGVWVVSYERGSNPSTRPICAVLCFAEHIL
jgi:hypothetical protein